MQIPGSSPHPTESTADSAIRAAFVAFHRRTTSAGAAGRRRLAVLSGGGWAFLVLALVGFGGGLFLSSLSFSSPEASITIAGVAPEVLYVRPTGADPAAAAAANQQEAQSRDHTFAAARPAGESAPENREVRAPSTMDLAIEIPAAVLAQVALPEMTANFAAAARLGAVRGHGPGTGAEPIESGYGAVEVPSIPEPATGLIVGIGLAALIAVQRFARKRQPLTATLR